MIPKPIYEALPLTYMAVGVVSVLSLTPIFGQLSGALMAYVGYRVRSMRKQYRAVHGVRRVVRR